MWHHGRLLRRVLLVSSLLTLGGLHVPGRASPDGWRVIRLVPLTLGLAAAITNAAATLTAGDAITVLYSMLFGLVTWHAQLVLVHLQRHRRQLHALLLRAAELEEATALCRRPGDHAPFQRSVAVIGVLVVATIAVWSVGFFAAGEWEHPNYLFPILVPAALQGRTWYWVLIGLQVVAVIASFTFQSVFDLLLIGLMDAVALCLERFTRYTRLYLADVPVKLGQVTACTGEESDSAKVVAVAGQGAVRPVENTSVDSTSRSGQAAVGSGDWPYNASIDAPMKSGGSEEPNDVGAPGHEPSLADPGADLESGLRRLAETHRALHGLASDAAALCSVLTLSLHASVTAVLLVGLYVTIALFGRGDKGTVLLGSLVLFLAMTVLRLAAVCCVGSRLITCGEELLAALVGARWSRWPTGPVRFALQMLVEQTRKPIAFDGYGMFTTQKGTMLSLLSFVLTYFIIMVQMKV